MVLFNIPFESMRTMLTLETGLIIYIEDEEKIDVYIQNGYCLLKSTYLKVDTEQDLIWKDDNLKRALRAFSIDTGKVTFKIVKEEGGY